MTPRNRSCASNNSLTSTPPAENYLLGPVKGGSLAKAGEHCHAEPNNIEQPAKRWQEDLTSDMLDIISWIGASKMLWTAGSIFFGDRLWRREATTSSPLQKAKLPNWQSRHVEEWKQWALETIEETDRRRTVWEGLNWCMFLTFTMDLQRKAPETQF